MPPLMDIKISIIDIYFANLTFLYFMNEKFDKNAKVEKLTKKLGRGVRLIVIHFVGPSIFCYKTVNGFHI